MHFTQSIPTKIICLLHSLAVNFTKRAFTGIKWFTIQFSNIDPHIIQSTYALLIQHIKLVRYIHRMESSYSSQTIKVLLMAVWHEDLAGQMPWSPKCFVAFSGSKFFISHTLREPRFVKILLSNTTVYMIRFTSQSMWSSLNQSSLPQS